MNTEALQRAFEALVRKAYDIAARPFVEQRDSAGLLIIAAQRDYILSFNVRTFLRPPYIPAFSALLRSLDIILEPDKSPPAGIFVLNELHEAIENFAKLAGFDARPPSPPGPPFPPTEGAGGGSR